MSKVKGLFLKLKGLWRTPLEGRYLTLRETANYFLYTMGVSMLINVINYVATVSFIPYFYEIDTIHAYAIVAAGSFFSMAGQTFLGNLIEKTKSKWGKYKPYILFSLPLLSFFALTVTFIPQITDENMRILYAYLSCVPALVLSTFFNNMYQVMPSVITPDAQERSDLMTPVGLVAGLAPSLLQIIAGPVRAHFKAQGAEYLGLRIIGIIYVALGVLAVLFILRVKERVFRSAENKDEKDLTLRFTFASLVKNKALLILGAALILGSLRDFTVQFRLLIIQFRFSDNMDTAIKISGLPTIIISFAHTLAILALPLLTRRMDKHKILALFTLFGVASNAVLGLIGYENIPVGVTSIAVITVLHFIGTLTPVTILVPVMLGEIADYQQTICGKRLEGHIQNILFTVPVFISQLMMIGLWFWQKNIGFEAKDYADLTVLSAEQQAVACEWFDAVAIISAVSGLLMAGLLLLYPLTRKKHKQAVALLTRETQSWET